MGWRNLLFVRSLTWNYLVVHLLDCVAFADRLFLFYLSLGAERQIIVINVGLRACFDVFEYHAFPDSRSAISIRLDSKDSWMTNSDVLGGSSLFSLPQSEKFLFTFGCCYVGIGTSCTWDEIRFDLCTSFVRY